MRNLKLGHFFSLREFIVSDSYPHLVKDITLTEHEITNLFYLVQFALDPIRLKFGRVDITSAVRPPMLNRLVGGVEDSQHVRCEAADFVTPHGDPFQVFTFVTAQLHWPGEFIWYKPDARYHIALPRIGVRSDLLIHEDGRYKPVEA